MTGEEMFGAPTPGEAVTDHGPMENIAGGQPARRWKHDARGKAYPADLIEKGRQPMTPVTIAREQYNATGNAQTITAPLTVTADQLDLVKRTVANGASDAELKLYLYDCQRQGVHPLDRLLHFTKRSGKYTPVTSIDLMRIRAAETGEYAGSDDAMFQPKPTGMDPNKEHLPPSCATVTVHRLVQGQRCQFTATARWAEYCPGQGQDHMWKKMPHTMLAKCAEALALRKGFPRQLAGLYAKEEMDQADGPSVVTAPNAYPPPQPAGSLLQAATPPPTADGAALAHAYEQKRSDEGPDLGVDLPAGARRVVKVGLGIAGAKASITFNAPVGDSGKAELLTFSARIAQIANQFAHEQTPCFPGLKRSESGNWRVEDLVAVPKDYDPPEGLPQPKGMLSDKDVPW